MSSPQQGLKCLSQNTKLQVGSLILRVLERAVRNCPWSASLVVSQVQAMERFQQPHQKVVGKSICVPDVNSLVPGSCGCNSENVIFKLIKQNNSMNSLGICRDIALRWIPPVESHWYEINIGSGDGLVPLGNKPLREPMLPRSVSPYGVTRPQWVNYFVWWIHKYRLSALTAR